jgi:ferredoxin, 2Fe-2S
MPKVTFYPIGKSGDVPAGISVLDAAEKLGMEMRHDCGGFATCSTCRIWVVEGAPNLTEVDLDEENMLEEASLAPPFRLSCQAKIQGDVIVQVPNEEMEWSKGALRELQGIPAPLGQIVRMMVEKKARTQGVPVILPDTAIPLVAEAKKELEEGGTDPARLTAMIKRMYEEGDGAAL